MEQKMINNGSGAGTGLVSTLFNQVTAPFVRLRSRLRRRTFSEIGAGMGDCIRGQRTGGGRGRGCGRGQAMGGRAGRGLGQGGGQNRTR